MHEGRGTKMSNPIATFACAAILGVCGTVASAQAADKVIMGTGWLAQAEHGGFYQAVVDGTYAKTVSTCRSSWVGRRRRRRRS